MQLYSVVEITNLEPLKIGAGGNKANQIEPSKDYIPGSTIRGAIIGQLIRRRLFDDCKNAILTQMECYNAYPCVDGNLYIPAPQHLRINKHEYRRAKVESRYDHSGNAGTIALTNLHDGSELSNHDALAFRFISVQNGELTGLNPVKEYRLHHNTSRNRGEKERENLFRYQALAPGHTFRTIIRYDESLAGVLEPIIQQPMNLYLGGAKGSGYGLCRMQPLEIHVTEYGEATEQLGLHTLLNSKVSSPSSQLTITCLSDCVFRNEYGQPVNYLPESEIHRITGVSVKQIKQYVQAGMTEGYNMTWKARYPKETTLKAGSVLVYQLNSELGSEELKQVKQALECKPVGYRIQDGYGWLAVNLSYPERMAVRSLQPIAEYREDSAKYAEPDCSVNPQEVEVMSILLAGLEPVKQRWLELLTCKLQEQGEQSGERVVVSNQLNSSQLQQMKEILQPLIKQLKNGDVPSLPSDNTDRSYKKDNRLCSIAGHHFKELITFICSAASSSGSLSQFAQNKLNGKKGSLLFSQARYREQQFIAELLYTGLHVEQRRKDK